MSTPKEMALENESPFNCPNCGKELGTTDGRQLRIGDVIFWGATELTCARCLKPYHWEPVAEANE